MDKQKRISVFTDGSCLGNPGKGEYCAIMNNKFPQLMSVQEFIDNLSENKKSSIGINKLYSLIKQDDFPSVKIGGRYYILVDKFSDWLDQQMNNKAECIKNEKHDQSGENSHE